MIRTRKTTSEFRRIRAPHQQMLSGRVSAENGNAAPFSPDVSGVIKLLVTEAATARRRELKQARVNRAWLEEAVEHGAADLDFSSVVTTIRGEKR